MATDIIIAVITAVGGMFAGIFGAGGLLAAWMNRKIKKAYEENQKREDARFKRYVAIDKKDHALGRLIFWIVRGIERYENIRDNMIWNGEVRESYNDFEIAEAELKKIDREQLAEQHIKK
ncbi:MAG: hypothetical protein RR389_07295 [Christensenella sp.]